MHIELKMKMAVLEVPLHGRLFAQWMHYAFPRHCPFPHVSGTKRQSLTEFQAERHERAAFAEYNEMRELSEQRSSQRARDFGMWSEDEELIDPEGHLRKARSELSLFETLLDVN